MYNFSPRLGFVVSGKKYWKKNIRMDPDISDLQVGM